jgi:hypothetical protein
MVVVVVVVAVVEWVPIERYILPFVLSEYHHHHHHHKAWKAHTPQGGRENLGAEDTNDGCDVRNIRHPQHNYR